MKFKDFTLHVFEGYVQNNFIVEYKDKILLIDGATSPDAEPIAGFVTNKLGRDIADLKLTAVTHCHPDHAGAADILRGKYRIPVAAPRDIDLWYSGIGGYLQHKSDTWQSQFMAKQLKENLKTESLHYKRLLYPDYKLDDNSVLPFFSDWRAIHAPGHTSHNVMLYNESNRLLYVADTMINSRKKYLPPVPVLFPMAMKKTLMKIKELNPKLILFAHSSSPVMQYNEVMVDETVKKVDSVDSIYIRLFYLISKFTGEYRKNRE